jgi:hypothetical protein
MLKVEGRELFYAYMVDNQAIVIPETIDAIRALRALKPMVAPLFSGQIQLSGFEARSSSPEDRFKLVQASAEHLEPRRPRNSLAVIWTLVAQKNADPTVALPIRTPQKIFFRDDPSQCNALAVQHLPRHCGTSRQRRPSRPEHFSLGIPDSQRNRY